MVRVRQATQLTGLFDIVAGKLDFAGLNSMSNILIQNDLIGYNKWNIYEHDVPRQI